MPDFDDPFKSPESTVLRPRPGAGRRGAGEAPAPRQAPGASHVEAVPASAMDALGVGLNPLVRAASPLLILTGQLRGTLAGPDIPTLRRHALDEIRRFEDRARAGGIQNEVVLAARYALCAGMDEAVLSTPWGAQSEWAQQTLLVALHREAWGGEKFFEMLDRISSDPKRHIDLMELLYLCLAFGFAGKYQVADRGHTRLSDIQHELYRKIRDYRGAPRNELSLRWKGIEDRRNPLIRYVPWWVVGAAALAVIVGAYATFYSLLAGEASPVYEQVQKIGSEELYGPVAPASGAGRLRTHLTTEEGRGQLTIVEEGGRTRVILKAPDLFASGSARVNEKYHELIGRIANALNQVPEGQVWVVGHTDSQPFRDNEALSFARARSVGAILRKTVADPGRLNHEGRGSREPLPNEPDPALNRRVEIIHVRGS